MGMLDIFILDSLTWTQCTVWRNSQVFQQIMGENWFLASLFIKLWPALDFNVGELVSCGLVYLDLNLLPVFNHFGFIESAGNSGYCGCDISSIFTGACNGEYSSVWSFLIINLFFNVFFVFTAYSFVTGFIFYNFAQFTADGQFNNIGSRASIYSYIDLSVKYKNNLVGLNRDGFDACKESSVRGLSTDQASRDSIYKFCAGSFETRHIVIRI